MVMVQEPVGGYAWVEPLEAYCFTAVVGVEPDEVVRRLGADPDVSTWRTFEECFWMPDRPQWAQVGAIDGAVLIAENNGWRGEEDAERLSVGGRLACFFRNVSAVMHFVYAADGAVLADFDPLLDEPAAAHREPALVTRAMEGLPFGLFGAEPSAMTLLQRLTGVQVTRTWLTTPQRSILLPALPPVTAGRRE
jgi:hypothetical protein